MSDGENRRSRIFKMSDRNILSIFVDESGNFSFEKESSRFYIVCFVMHDQNSSIDDHVRKLDSDLDRMGFSNLCFHAGPIIRHEDGYEFMNWELRNRIFSKMMAFYRKAELSYHCFTVDKKFVSSESQIVDRLKTDIKAFLEGLRLSSENSRPLKVYYDCGQTPITNMLKEAMTSVYGNDWEFAQDVKPIKYKLFQVADLICTTTLIEQKIINGLQTTKSEDKFFGGFRNFKRNVLKLIKRKEI